MYLRFWECIVKFPSWLWKAPLIQKILIRTAMCLGLLWKMQNNMLITRISPPLFPHFRISRWLWNSSCHTLLTSALHSHDSLELSREKGRKPDDRKDKVYQQTWPFLSSEGLNIFLQEKYGSVFKNDTTYLLSRNAIFQWEMYWVSCVLVHFVKEKVSQTINYLSGRKYRAMP